MLSSLQNRASLLQNSLQVMLPNVCVCMNQLLKVIPEKWIFSIFNKLEVIGFCQNPYCYRVCKSWLLGVGNRSWKQKHKTSTKEAFFFLFFLNSCGWNVWKNGKIFLFLFVSAFSLFVFWSNKISHHGTSIIGKSSQPYRIYKGYANGYWYKECNFSFSKIQGHVHGQSGAVIYIHISIT